MTDREHDQEVAEYGRIIEDNGLDLTDTEVASAISVCDRLGAKRMSLYRTSEGLRAFVVGQADEEHTGVPVVGMVD